MKELLNRLRRDFQKIHPTAPALWQFGLLVAVMLLAWGGWQAWHRHDFLRLGIAAGGALGVVALGRWLPAVLRPFYVLWMGLAVVLGLVMFTFIRGLRSLFGGGQFERRIDRNATTYWIQRTPTPPDTRMNRQF
jgi:hypothetical protein